MAVVNGVRERSGNRPGEGKGEGRGEDEASGTSARNVIKPRRKLSTFDKYEAHVRPYLVPLLGAKRLESLGVADVRRFLVRLEKETTAATAKESHRVLRSALSSACREELITRNVAKLVEPPARTSAS